MNTHTKTRTGQVQVDIDFIANTNGKPAVCIGTRIISMPAGTENNAEEIVNRLMEGDQAARFGHAIDAMQQAWDEWGGNTTVK